MRDELEKRGLETTGLKAALVERLENALQSQDDVAEKSTVSSPKAGAEEEQKIPDDQVGNFLKVGEPLRSE